MRVYYLSVVSAIKGPQKYLEMFAVEYQNTQKLHRKRRGLKLPCKLRNIALRWKAKCKLPNFVKGQARKLNLLGRKSL